MWKTEDIKKEILKAAALENLTTELQKARAAVSASTEKVAEYRAQAEGLDAQAVALDTTIRAGLSEGKNVDGEIQKRGVLRTKKVELDALAEEIEAIVLPAARETRDGCQKGLFESLQKAVMETHNIFQSKLNGELAEIEADLLTWTAAVAAVQSEFAPTMPFSGATITLKNYAVKWAMGI